MNRKITETNRQRKTEMDTNRRGLRQEEPTEMNISGDSLQGNKKLRIPKISAVTEKN